MASERVAVQQVASVVYTKEQRPVPADYRVPDYMEKIYTWCYVKPKNVKMLDRQAVVQTILFGYFQPLANMVCSELKPGQKLLQCGSTYGRSWDRRERTTAAISCRFRWPPATARCQSTRATVGAFWRTRRRTILRRTSSTTLRGSERSA